MKKVFIVHGLNGYPNSSWFPWLMAELKAMDVYACSLFMPNPEKPICSEWVDEIARIVQKNSEDQIYLVGHSLGVAGILNYLGSSEPTKKVAGIVLASGRFEPTTNPESEGFYNGFDFEKIKANIEKVAIIHGDNDDRVPVKNAHDFAMAFGVTPTIIENGKHLNGSAGWRTLPQCMECLKEMMS